MLSLSPTQRILTKLLPSRSYPGISIVEFVKQYYQLDSDLEFLVRYYLSRVDFQQIWDSKPRTKREEIESFYRETDADIWRQAYLSRYSAHYKRKILKLANRIFHLPKLQKLYQSHNASTTVSSLCILDYGCGAGVLLHYLQQLGFESLTGADIPSRTLNFCRSVYRGISWIELLEPDACGALGNQFDVVVCVEVLEHTLHLEAIAEILVQCLVPGGELLLSFPEEQDFQCTHLAAAQEARPRVLRYLSNTLYEVVKNEVYIKR